VARHLRRAGRSAERTGQVAESGPAGHWFSERRVRPGRYGSSLSPGSARWRSSIAVRCASRAG